MSVPKEERRIYSNHPRINRLLSSIIEELRQFTEDQAVQIKELTAIGTALSAESDTRVILEMILSHARRFTNADGGTLYLVNDNETELVFNVVHNDTLNTFMGGTSGNLVTLPNVQLYTEDGSENNANVSAYCANTGEVVNIPDVYEHEGFNFEGMKKFDEKLNYRAKSMLVVPMRDHEDDIIGVLQLINAKQRITNDVIQFSPDAVDMTTALASQAAVVITQQRLISELKLLFESFIKAIATAIDEKSRYTGGHIERVAHLTMAIAEKINETKKGALADLTFSQAQMDELRIAAWLHDTGKITTPEYVVDKSAKLETVFDRIELLRTRWQAIRLARKVDEVNSKLELVKEEIDPIKVKEIEEAYDGDLESFQSYLDFLETANVGDEFMADEKLDLLNSIAKRKYTVDGKKFSFIDNDEKLNLSVRKGTLNDEERTVMNNHAGMTIKILDTLPWPKRMTDVPGIAGAHHEKLDGTGYPNGLKGDEISMQARIMAVADVFEALSAKDRPYKKPMPLSQAKKILGFMVQDKHLDKDIVELFIESGLYLQYAKENLDPSQIDITE